MLACPAAPASPPPAVDRPRYELNVDVRPGFKLVKGDVTVRFTPNRATGRLVFRLWPNGPRQVLEGARLDTGVPTSGGRRLVAEVTNPTTLVVRVRLAAGQSITVDLPWTLHVPAFGLDRIARWSGGVRLGSFFPILAWDPRRGWLTDPPTELLGETSTSPTADFDVHVKVPHGFTALVSGTQVGDDHWHAHAVRDVAVAAGSFRVVTTIVHAPNPVSMHVAVSGGAVDPAKVVRFATFALRTFSRKYGPYRWSTYSLVASPDMENTGIEYPTLVFLGRATSQSLLRPIVVHETAHQWFYSLVGDDQARDPWLDEALATWSEAIADRTLRRQLAEMPPGVRRHVGASVAFFRTRAQEYTLQVYAGGLQALASLGSVRGVDCALRLYVARDAYRIAQPTDLLAALSRVFPGAARRLRRFGIHR